MSLRNRIQLVIVWLIYVLLFSIHSPVDLHVTEETDTQGFFPVFSLRLFFIVFTLATFFAWVIRQAIIGQLWAQALVATGTAVVLLFVIYAIIFLCIWVPAIFGSPATAEVATGDPFADGQLPPQVVRPNDRDTAS